MTADGVYRALVEDILASGTRVSERTGTGALSVVHRTLRVDLREGFPLLTTKRVPFRWVAEEMLWMVSGSTDARRLSARGVTIWDANASRAFLDRHGFPHRREGDLGPTYGHQWRHFGAEYSDADAGYAGKGVDQLAGVVRAIRSEPNSRRILMTAWNPAQLGQTPLPPCHYSAHFIAREDATLHCVVTMRSCDVGVGLPFNIAGYALLLSLVARVTRRQAGELSFSLEDAHIYSNHVEGLREQIAREPRPPPSLTITRDTEDIDRFTVDDLRLEGYDPHPPIRMPMAV